MIPARDCTKSAEEPNFDPRVWGLGVQLWLFRTFGAVSGAEQGNLRGIDNPSMQEIQLRPAEHLTFDQLEPVDVALDRAGALLG